MADRTIMTDETLAEMFPDPRAYARAKPLYNRLEDRYRKWQISLLEPETTPEEWAAIATDLPNEVLIQEQRRRFALTQNLESMPDEVLAAEVAKRQLSSKAPL